jgi:hypothetical protein
MEKFLKEKTFAISESMQKLIEYVVDRFRKGKVKEKQMQMTKEIFRSIIVTVGLLMFLLGSLMFLVFLD